MAIITPPERPEPVPGSLLVFLAGSIEMGKAERWQERVAETLLNSHPDLVIANPRRPDWDSSWEQSIENPHFKEQVDWELDHLDRSDLALFYFQADTQAPITLLELGRHLARKDAQDSTLVCCPPGFWRRGNVEIVMDRAGLGLPFQTLEEMIRAAVSTLRERLDHRP